MDISTQAEIILRDEGYASWAWTGVSPNVICFESATLMGFLQVFDTADALVGGWEVSQQLVLARHSSSLRAAGTKAWNVYSIFLTSDVSDRQRRAIERLEEDFSLTRKIARAGVRTSQDLERALLPLLSIRAKPLLGASNFEDRLRVRLGKLPSSAVTAFLSDAPDGDIVRILGEDL